MVDEDQLQLRVYEVYEYYGRELYAYVDDVPVDLRQLKVSSVDSVGGRLELSSVRLFNGLTFARPCSLGVRESRETCQARYSSWAQA